LPHAYVLYSSIKINLPRVSAGFCLSPVHSPNAPTRPAGASVRALLSSRPSRSVRSRSFIVVSIRAGMGLYFCNSRVRRSAQYKVTAKVTTAVTTITNHMRSRGTVLLRHFIGAKAAEPWAPCRSSCLTAPSARRLCHGPHHPQTPITKLGAASLALKRPSAPQIEGKLTE
jgi:hypothetical protein